MRHLNEIYNDIEQKENNNTYKPVIHMYKEYIVEVIEKEKKLIINISNNKKSYILIS